MVQEYSKKSHRIILVGFLIVLLGSNLVNYLMFGYAPSVQPDGDPQEKPEQTEALPETEEMEIFTRVLELLSDYYLNPVDRAALIRGAVKGMLKTLEDPQTSFYEAQELENFLVHTMGSFGGIGVRIVDVGQSVVIFETIPGTPAERAGLYPGDRIRSADGEDLTGQGVGRAAELLRGPQGTLVTVSIERPGAREPLTITLERDQVKLNTVSSRILEPGLGYIEISSFDSHTGANFTAQLQELKAAGGLEQGLILDLRNNTGGLVDESIKVAKLLVPEGEITRLVDRNEQIRDIHYSSAPPRPYPIVVLVNEETASAAEIVAGALQDRGAALLVGEQTYGKATVQHLEYLPGDSALRITVAKYRTPSGKDIDGQGLEPDFTVELSRALKYYRYFLPGRLEEGSYGMDVEMLQDMLAELGYPVEPAGYFDEATAAALAAFQEQAGIEASGLFDDLTWVELRVALDQASQNSDTQLQKGLELIRQPGHWANLGR